MYGMPLTVIAGLSSFLSQHNASPAILTHATSRVRAQAPQNLPSLCGVVLTRCTAGNATAGFSGCSWAISTTSCSFQTNNGFYPSSNSYICSRNTPAAGAAPGIVLVTLVCMHGDASKRQSFISFSFPIRSCITASIVSGSRQYLAFAERRTWPDAAVACTSIGARLAAFHRPEDYTAFQTAASRLARFKLLS